MNTHDLYVELAKIDPNLPFLTNVLLGGSCSQNPCTCKEALQKENDVIAFLDRKLKHCQSIVDVTTNALLLNPVVQLAINPASEKLNNDPAIKNENQRQMIIDSVTID